MQSASQGTSWAVEGAAEFIESSPKVFTRCSPHLRLHVERRPDPWRAVIETRKFAPFYLQPLAHGERLRGQINRLNRVDEIERLLQGELNHG